MKDIIGMFVLASVFAAITAGGVYAFARFWSYDRANWLGIGTFCFGFIAWFMFIRLKS